MKTLLTVGTVVVLPDEGFTGVQDTLATTVFGLTRGRGARQ